METSQPHMAIADSRYLWTEVDRLKSQVQELRTSSRVAQDERTRTVELLASFVTRAQLDAALSTKGSLAHVDALMDTLRAEMVLKLDHKADLALVAFLQSTKLDVSVFDANAWDLQKLRVAMEQHVRDLFATFAGLVEQQVSSKLAIEDFNRVFSPEATGQKASLESAALRFTKMTDQLESLSNYMNGDKQRQRQLAELNVGMLDITRKQAATRNSIVQLESTEQTATAQLRALDEQTTQAIANLQSLTETLSGLQTQTQADKNAQDARQSRLSDTVKQLEARSQHFTQTLNELGHFARAGLVDSIDVKLKANADNLRNELNEAGAMHHQRTQQVNVRMTKANDQLQHHKEHLSQLDACMRKMAELLKDTQGELNNVKGPLATLATNLHEENVVILQEIERSQNGTRNIILDYQDLLVRDKNSQVFVPLPPRPSSSCSTSSCGSTSRKQKQQMGLATKAATRPHTSGGRIRASSTSNGVLPVDIRRSAGAVRTNRSPSIPWRAQTAGVPPQVLANLNTLPGSDNNPCVVEQEVRMVSPVLVRQDGPWEQKVRHESVPQRFFRRVADTGDEDLFHFPDS